MHAAPHIPIIMPGTNISAMTAPVPAINKTIKLIGPIIYIKGSEGNNLAFFIASAGCLCPLLNWRILNAAKTALPVHLNRIEQIQPKSTNKKLLVISFLTLKVKG